MLGDLPPIPILLYTMERGERAASGLLHTLNPRFYDSVTAYNLKKGGVHTVLTMLGQGGWTMIPLMVASVAALAIILERGWMLQRRHVLDKSLLEAMERCPEEMTPEQLGLLSKRSAAPLGRIVSEVLRVRHLDHAQAIECVNAVGRMALAQLERGLTLLEIIAGVSPLLGLFGTVLGMVDVFQAITAAGLGDPQILTGGIAKALITTVAGLAIAIPAVTFHSLYLRRVEEFGTELQNLATALLVRLQEAERGRVSRDTQGLRK